MNREEKIEQKINLLNIEMELGKVAFIGSLTVLAFAATVMQINPQNSFKSISVGIIILLSATLFLILFFIGYKQIANVEKTKNILKKEIEMIDAEN